MKLFDKMFETSLAASKQFTSVIKNVGTLAHEVGKLAQTVANMVEHIESHNRAIVDLYEANGIIIKLIRGGTQETKMPELKTGTTKTTPEKPN